MLARTSLEMLGNLMEIARGRTTSGLRRWCLEAMILGDERLAMVLVQEIARRIARAADETGSTDASSLEWGAMQFLASETGLDEEPATHVLLFDQAGAHLVFHDFEPGGMTHEGHAAYARAVWPLLEPLLARAARGGFAMDGRWYDTVRGFRHWTTGVVPVWRQGQIASILCFLADTTISRVHETDVAPVSMPGSESDAASAAG